MNLGNRWQRSDLGRIPFSNTKAFKIKSDDKYFACAVLFQQYEEWKKIRRDPSDPAPTNTSNGESYDPPNRLNGCTIEND